MNKKAFAGFMERLQNILDEMDNIEMTDELEELNAEFEDALFMLEDFDPDDGDAQEELEESLDELNALLANYRELCDEIPALCQQVTEFEMCLKMIENNMI